MLFDECFSSKEESKKIFDAYKNQVLTINARYRTEAEQNQLYCASMQGGSMSMAMGTNTATGGGNTDFLVTAIADHFQEEAWEKKALDNPEKFLDEDLERELSKSLARDAAQLHVLSKKVELLLEQTRDLEIRREEVIEEQRDLRIKRQRLISNFITFFRWDRVREIEEMIESKGTSIKDYTKQIERKDIKRGEFLSEIKSIKDRLEEEGVNFLGLGLNQL